MRGQRVGIGMTKGVVAFGVGLLLAGCAGGAQPTPPPLPPAPGESEPAAETGPVVPVRTDEEPGQMARPEIVPQPRVFGVDLDTVQAGRFDQGKMWTFEFPPVEYFAEEYGFRPDAAWFERARLGALRIPSCSASFVSPHGLVLTNHHCAREFVTQVQQDGESLLDDGFYAKNLDEERPVEEFEADQLIEIVDVTDEVNAAVDAAAEAERGDAREQILEEIEERLTEERGGEDAGIVVEMVSLYNGGRTSAYVFHRYTNVKLVMAPELQMGFFGGDPDNFTYPRYNLDFSFFRIYDDAGEPLTPEVHFSVDDDGLEEGKAVFIVGNPGSTSRLQTVAELEYRRDIADRLFVDLLRSRMEVLDGFIRSNPDEAETYDLRNQYFSLSNSEKATAGQVEGLQDPVIMARRRDTERHFQEAIDSDPGLRARYGSLISSMADIQEEKRSIEDVTAAFAGFGAPFIDSSTIVRALWATQVLFLTQSGAPEEDIEPMMEGLKSSPQMPAGLDAALLAARIQDMVDHLGSFHPAVQNVLQGGTAEQVAEAVVGSSVLADSAGAVAAAEGGTLTPQDPALQVMIAMLQPFIEYNNTLAGASEREQVIAADLGRARFEVYGTDTPPDATFSLRIADGIVSGYEYNGTTAPWQTTFYGMYDRHFSHVGEEDWALPARWAAPPAGLDLGTPLNFVSTVDIIGGNSGSPVLDEELEVVGVVFDGNIESLPGDYIYLPEANRSVTVDIRAILAALDHVYDLDRLVLELTTGTLARTEAEADAMR